MMSRLREAPASEGIRRMFKPPDWEWSQIGDVGWWSRDGWGDVLLGPQGLRLDEWREAGTAHDDQIGAASRSSTASTFPRERSTSSTSWCRTGGPRSASGFAAARGGTKASAPSTWPSIGVPTITPVALGEQRKRKFLFENYLVTLAISDAIPLDEFVERQLAGVARAAALADPPEARRGHGRHDGPAARRGSAAPRLSSRQHHGSPRCRP